jgi:hypothetical protein
MQGTPIPGLIYNIHYSNVAYLLIKSNCQSLNYLFVNVVKTVVRPSLRFTTFCETGDRFSLMNNLQEEYNN